jgi:hypothetical protein
MKEYQDWRDLVELKGGISVLKRIENWILGLLRAEIEAFEARLKADLQELHSGHTNSLKQHVTAELKKTIRKGCSFCGRMSSDFETEAGKIRCSVCSAEGVPWA